MKLENFKIRDEIFIVAILHTFLATQTIKRKARMKEEVVLFLR
jgi:hypothetical protein